MRHLFKIILLLAVAALGLYLRSADDKPARERQEPRAPYVASQTAPLRWGNPRALRDHFVRHGADFGARNPEDYERMASEFQERARREGLPAKVDGNGVLRIYDPRSGAFGAYNRDGTTRTLFKPGNRGYFERQPGKRVTLEIR